MATVKIDDLIEVAAYKNALERPSDAEYEGLKTIIEESGQCLMPILYHFDALGAPQVVDGYTRLEIYRERPDIFEEPPRCIEVMCLSGESEEAVVDWIKRHQAFRRNNEKLILQYSLGKAAVEHGRPQTAATHNTSLDKIRHAEELAKAVDTVDELEPGLKDKILESDVPANVVREAASTGDTTRLQSVLSGGPKRQSTQGTLGHFKKIRSLLGKTARALNDLENETTENSWSENIQKLINSIGAELDQWEESEA